MHLTEDTLVFEKGFEFAVYPYVAKVQENDENSFHWHRYCEITLVEKAKADTLSMEESTAWKQAI